MDRRGFNRRGIGGQKGKAPVEQMRAMFGSSLVAMYVADPEWITLNGSNVSGWADISGNGNHLTQGTASSQPAWEDEGWGSKGAIVMNDSNDGLYTTSASLVDFVEGEDTPFTILGLFQLTATTDTNSQLIGWMGDTPATNPSIAIRAQASTRLSCFPRYYDGGNFAQPTVEGTPDTHAHTVGLTRHGTTSTMWMDLGKAVNAATMDVASSTFTRFGIGSGQLAGTVARHRMWLVINRAITDDEYRAWRQLADQDSGLIWSTSDPLTALSQMFSGDALATWLADPGYVTLNGSNVSSWVDLTGNGNFLTQGTADNQPAFEASGWDGKGSVLYATGDELSLTGGVADFIDGDDVPVTVLTMLQLESFNNSGVLGWYTAAAADALSFRPIGSGDGRWLGTGGATTGAGSFQLGTARRSMVFSMLGTTASGWVDGTKVLNAAAFNTTTQDAETFRMRSGSPTWRVRYCTVVDRAITDWEASNWHGFAQHI
jgi:hypothetical protein